VGVLFLLLIFLLLQSTLVYTPGVPIHLPETGELPGAANPTVTVAADQAGQLYYRQQVVTEAELREQLTRKVRETPQPLTLVLMADKDLSNERLVRLFDLARETGIQQAVLATRFTRSSRAAGPGR
jgi:biopolymer transport protein ExbD